MAEIPHSTAATAPDSQKSLRGHLEAMQGEAYIAESLVSVVIACGRNPKHNGIALAAAEAAQEVLSGLGRALDSVELDQVLA